MKQLFYAISVATLLLGNSCQQNAGTTPEEINDTVEAASTRQKLVPVELIPIGSSPSFDDATLSIASVMGVVQGADSTKVSIAFGVKNYELKGQTPDAESKDCNNSDKGQHIHFILDNQPYTALYEPKHEIVLAKNTEHYLMCFLSRSYHESIKSKGAAVVYHFKIDENGKLIKLENPKTPMLFYSRPKGDYLGKDTVNLLLDYYVWNAKLGADYKVKALISNSKNAQEKELLLDSWQPMFIQNLGVGKSSVSITLVDKDGKDIVGPMTTVTRNFQMAAQEPLQ